MMPIQLRAACDPSRTEALFSEGSSGEYDASARKRRSAETHSTNPTSSFNRRFLPGSKIFEKNVIWQATTPAGQDSPDNVVTWPELDNYDKKPEAATIFEKATGGELGSGGTAGLGGRCEGDVTTAKRIGIAPTPRLSVTCRIYQRKIRCQ
jgi:hypothetical protein